ncbi:NnrS family protein [Pelagibacterium limicola]|uniref:NnrS family protein n=1 Tax=Pelagibacterium limicola TaxID=2791022 RepID=UPI0018AFC944
MFFTRIANGGIPRGIAANGPAILSYGFRPFFLLAGVWAILAMSLWVMALISGWPVGGTFGPVNWHAHEMVFGYTSAVMGGFMLTAIPNWTGRLPVSGTPLLALVALWFAGRLALLFPDALGLPISLTIEAAFLPALTLVALREIMAGRNWKNLKILAGLSALTTANIWFHILAFSGEDTSIASRMAIAALVMLICLVGGRIVPSFTRNWLSRRRQKLLPAPFDRFDQGTLLLTLAAFVLWVSAPDDWLTAALCFAAGIAQGLRLVRWRGGSSWREPIVGALHLAYAFVPLGLVVIGFGATGLLTHASAAHVLLVGAIGGMTLAVMSRAALGHTGREIKAPVLIVVAYSYVAAAALVRPLVDLVPALYFPIFSVSGLLWIFAFALFCAVYAPILLKPRVEKAR